MPQPNKSLASRPLDLFYFVYFLIHLPMTILMGESHPSSNVDYQSNCARFTDAQVLYPSHLVPQPLLNATLGQSSYLHRKSELGPTCL